MADDLKSLFGRRLRQARSMRGWSLRQLADKIGGLVSYNALAKYEHGEMNPNGTVLIALADALKQSVDFFSRPFTLQLQNVRFRKKSRLGASAERGFLEQAADYFERYREIEELLGDVRTFTPPFPGARVMKVEDAEAFADRLRAEWELGLDRLPNSLQLLESHGIKVFELPTNDQQFDGLSAETDTGPVIVLASWLNGNRLRKRMTAIHELAHIVLKFPATFTETNEEAAVKIFAGAFLLPRKTFMEAFGRNRRSFSLSELIQLKLTFGVSIMAIMKRAQQLGLINDATYTRFCMAANQQGWRLKGEPGDELYTRPETYGRFRQLVYRAAAEDVIGLSRGATLLNQTLDNFRRDLKGVIA